MNDSYFACRHLVRVAMLASVLGFSGGDASGAKPGPVSEMLAGVRLGMQLDELPGAIRLDCPPVEKGETVCDVVAPSRTRFGKLQAGKVRAVEGSVAMILLSYEPSSDVKAMVAAMRATFGESDEDKLVNLGDAELRIEIWKTAGLQYSVSTQYKPHRGRMGEREVSQVLVMVNERS